MHATTRNRLGQTGLLCVVLALAYSLLGRMAFAVSRQYGDGTCMIFMPEGIALAFRILFGARIWPGILVGQTFLSVWSGSSPLTGLLIGVFNCVENAIGGRLFERWKISRRFDRPRDVALFVVLVFFVLQPISSTGGIFALYLQGAVFSGIRQAGWAAPWIDGQRLFYEFATAPPAWLRWWIGNALGQLTVTPLILSWCTPGTKASASSRTIDLCLLSGALSLIALIAFTGFPPHPLLLLGMICLLLIWIGQGAGLRGITLANVLIAVAMTWSGIAGMELGEQAPLQERLFNVGFVVAPVAVLSLMLFAMLEERRFLIQQLTEWASTDPLVKLSNRRHFIEVAEREIARARPGERGMVFMMLDADNFKQINDRYGHAAGDEALKAIAGACAQIAGNTDAAARLGGEEFALLLPGATLEAGRLAAERLRERIASIPVRIADRLSFSLTVSIGLAQLNENGNLDALMSAADSALYEAKRSGRNRVVVSERVPT
ncbi:diguanylate cyclase (GGDEF) domain-containing protein [Paraburkholderia caballeronis]|uniref:diguanylate cyclase n=1 Tax=Paraburkholderia caballeronis TaxID=416943 RepID=A0A1H7FY61_9BURK|nr:diguanylate cyclase (GGDEF)-like protein [Paraburkholderia caballeronis]PXX00526.1 diguanylate cyclase (GGDEF)-like protein [Paraburkholderia caballeronis]RAJ98589.1 diguanylate cyclase (GGDEF)-like protein [Paraburkholderia caballeronis]SEE67588.1 diguanylate cyclase (GGDEF) domain-containing protein [Paraburkholderia caballeronis]SEK30724.1 diguanylate cyclase (GGDEF) domain-containing protein [Paraburkholderia caballeronis]